jgi:hypothetical protein
MPSALRQPEKAAVAIPKRLRLEWAQALFTVRLPCLLRLCLSINWGGVSAEAAQAYASNEKSAA